MEYLGSTTSMRLSAIAIFLSPTDFGDPLAFPTTDTEMQRLLPYSSYLFCRLDFARLKVGEKILVTDLLASGTLVFCDSCVVCQFSFYNSECY